MTLGEAPQGNASLLASHQAPNRAQLQRQVTLQSPAPVRPLPQQRGPSECTGSATPSEVQENIVSLSWGSPGGQNKR